MSTEFTTRAPVLGCRGALATSNYLATGAGLQVLRRGGNAVDAIIAAGAVLNVVEPGFSHLGGDAFMLVWEARGRKLTAINASGRAPAGLRPEHFAGLAQIPAEGFLCSTVPGQVSGWEEAHGRFGTLPPAELLAEAIHYAEEGFAVSRDTAGSIAAHAEKLGRFPISAAQFLPGGRPPRRGEVLCQPDLARTLRLLAREGFRAFYEGELARRLATFWQAHGGVLTEADLAAHRAQVLEPIHTTYRGLDVFEQPPVSQGHILLQSLNLVEAFDLRALGHLSPECLHLCLEANKLSHADKDRYTTDPDFTPFPQGLLSKEYAAERATLISPDRAAPYPPPFGQPPASADTTYLCCVDGVGNAVSYIQSVFYGFGCGIVAEGTGVVLNDRGVGFSLDPRHVNFLQPGKRTVHTLNTYMVLRDGRPVIVGGTPGGDVQVQTNLQVLVGLLDFDRDPQQAAEDPRWWRGEGTSVGLESRAPREAFAGLRARGHQVQRAGPYGQGGRVQVIRIGADGVLTAGSDPRCDGCALAF